MTKPCKTKVEIAQMANKFAKLMGLTTQPALPKQTIGKVGSKGVPGIKVENQLQNDEHASLSTARIGIFPAADSSMAWSGILKLVASVA